MSRVRRHPLIVAGGGLVAVLAALVVAAVASGQVGLQDEPSEAEVAATVTAIRATVTVIYPRYDEDPPEPEFYGPFWLYPAGYEGEWPPVPTLEPCTGVTVDVRDPAVIKNAAMYVEIKDAPTGLTTTEPFVSAACGSEVRELTWQLDGQNPVQVVRWRAAFPVPVVIPPSHSWVALEKTSVGGNPAIFLRAKPGETGPVGIYIAEDRYVTTIVGEARQFDELVGLAQSIVEDSERRSGR